MGRKRALKASKEKAVVEKTVVFKCNKKRKRFSQPLKESNKPSTVRDRKNSLTKLLKALEASSGVNAMLFLHSPNWKKSSVRIRVYGKLGRKLKKTPAFKLIQKTFYKEVSLFNKTRPPPAEDKNALYVHTEDDPDPVDDKTLAEDEKVLDDALQAMPSYKGEHLNDDIPSEFESDDEGEESDEDLVYISDEDDEKVVATTSIPVTTKSKQNQMVMWPGINALAKLLNLAPVANSATLASITTPSARTPVRVSSTLASKAKSMPALTPVATSSSADSVKANTPSCVETTTKKMDEEAMKKRELLNKKRRERYQASDKFKHGCRTIYASDDDERPLKRGKTSHDKSKSNSKDKSDSASPAPDLPNPSSTKEKSDRVSVAEELEAEWQ
ncbi:hypothetical protein GHT06_008697 [Daphnia sinensis]|uniref:Uncharacterized protein n=1 Tax=Daphnia sinensis TaxID=1820382 RepID=A0AAD5LLK7_9CRUS|nr:hypothetical protein GHT06_008697 [Daphnia sinensis]